MTTGESNNQRHRRFLARYGATILRGGIATIPKALYRYQAELGLRPQQVWFVSAILAHKWDADMPKPSLKRMAAQTGVSEQQLHNYKNELVKAGWLAVVNRQNERGGQEANYYDFSVLFGALEERLRRDKPRPDDEPDDDDEEDEPDEGDVENSASILAGGLNSSLARGLKSHSARGLNPDLALKESVEKESVEEKEPSLFSNSTAIPLHKNKRPFRKAALRQQIRFSPALASPERLSDTAPGSAGFASVGGLLAQRHPLRTAPTGRDSSAGRGRPPKVSERVAVLVEELTHKLHDDPKNVRSNITRTARLWKASGLSDDAFYHRLHEAKSVTQQQGGVKKPATDGYGTLNRMPYFFAVVEDLLGLKDPPGDEGSGPGRKHAPQRR